jgi:hypothetical protein
MNALARTPDRKTLALLLLIAILFALVPRAFTEALEIPKAASWIGLADLAVLVVTHRLGWRQGMGSGWVLGLLATLAVACQGQPTAAILLMTISAFGIGLTARWQCQGVLVLLMLTPCFVIAESPIPLHNPEVLAFGGGLVGFTTLTAMATAWVERLGGYTPPPPQVSHGWKRALAFALLLAGTTAITTAIALIHNWALMGGWLILTPLMVMRPRARDSWPRALHRALGTMVGVGIVHLIALTAPGAIASPIVGVLFSAGTVLAAVKGWHHVLFIVFLTGAVVLFHSSATSVLALSQERLEANLLGIGIALGMMALVEAVFRHRDP